MRYTSTVSRIIAALVLAVILATPVRVSGWNNTGHRVIAYIAYQNLSPKVRSKVDQLLRKHPDIAKLKKGAVRGPNYDLIVFMNAATWPDDIRSDNRFYEDDERTRLTPRLPFFPSMERHRTWHFIDKPFSDDGSPLGDVSSPNILEKSREMYDKVSDPIISDAHKAYYLSWLIHLVGDMHQPLHCTSRFTKNHGRPFGDLAGNLFTITYGQRTTTLHSYWDDLFGTSENFNFIRGKATEATLKATESPKTDLSKDIWDQWVNESFHIATKFVYIVGPERIDVPTPVKTIYSKQAKEKAYKQAVWAGERLADILNEKFSS